MSVDTFTITVAHGLTPEFREALTRLVSVYIRAHDDIAPGSHSGSEAQRAKPGSTEPRSNLHAASVCRRMVRSVNTTARAAEFEIDGTDTHELDARARYVKYRVRAENGKLVATAYRREDAVGGTD